MLRRLTDNDDDDDNDDGTAHVYMRVNKPRRRVAALFYEQRQDADGGASQSRPAIHKSSMKLLSGLAAGGVGTRES
jgi:hypothetical protein